jgi:hypothetical protein
MALSTVSTVQLQSGTTTLLVMRLHLVLSGAIAGSSSNRHPPSLRVDLIAEEQQAMGFEISELTYDKVTLF